MKQNIFFSIPILLIIAVHQVASASPQSGEDILKEIDRRATLATDQFMVFDAVIKEEGKNERVMTFQVTVKGPQWRRVDFLAPGDMKGMRVLALSPSQMYVYMPAYRKVRRVASHVKEQGFMGSSYSQDEMALVTYGSTFSAKLVGEDDKHWHLALELRAGKEFPYPKLELDVRKGLYQTSEIRFLNEQGKKLKTETRTDYSCQGEVCGPGQLEMTDHSRGDLRTVLKRRQWKTNTGAPDSFFTVRALQRR